MSRLPARPQRAGAAAAGGPGAPTDDTAVLPVAAAVVATGAAAGKRNGRSAAACGRWPPRSTRGWVPDQGAASAPAVRPAGRRGGISAVDPGDRRGPRRDPDRPRPLPPSSCCRAPRSRSRPKVEPVGPLQLTIRADPTVTAPDPVAGVVPALQLSQDFTSFGTFNATGKKVVDHVGDGHDPLHQQRHEQLEVEFRPARPWPPSPASGSRRPRT